MCLTREVRDVWKHLLLPSGRLAEEGRCESLEVHVLLLEVGDHRLSQGQCLRRERIAVGGFWGLDIGVRVLRGQQKSMVQLAALLRAHHGSPLPKVCRAAATVNSEPELTGACALMRAMTHASR